MPLPSLPHDSSSVRRRDLLSLGVTASAGAVLSAASTVAAESTPAPARGEFRFCLNTSTIRGQKLSIVEEVELAAKVGYTGIEPWIRELQQYQESGGSMRDLRQRIADLGLRVESGIGFPTWAVDDEAERAKGVETFKRDADLLSQIGGRRIAAPPAGINRAEAPKVDLLAVADRYAALLQAGREIGVTPMAEIWGPSRNLSRLGEAVLVAVESGQPDACVLPDIYHVYRGGSGFAGLKLLTANAVQVFHINDYPTDRPRTELNDSDRVHVGDGQAPLDLIFRTLAANGCFPVLSLELFNPGYWAQPAEQVAREGLQKAQAAVQRALGTT